LMLSDILNLFYLVIYHQEYTNKKPPEGGS